KVIQESIKTFVSDIDQVKISRTPHLDMTVIKNNPSLENPLNGYGIVLIDEIDLHLHPKWQQTIVQKLENTFPNIQFILSTHSPLVLTTVTS
ncbi:AAA family ATPase, partial [Vibrio cholerae]|uniref:AAA family ATPase n=1 Tax=Vibrio cholerae TaxID=666 RepID=UPI000B30DCC1